jgi:glycosyltransferase involved in cell wall biosynthesis
MRIEKVSVVVPCFNEGKTIFDNMKTICDYMSRNFKDFEIIAVNDGSMDNTLSELRIVQQSNNVKIVNIEENQGKGNAVREGILSSRTESDVVMFLDADLAIPIDELGKFLDAINNGSDFAIASRFVPGLKVLKPVLWYRKIMNNAFRFLQMLILNSWEIRDTQCGFKVFRREAAEKVFRIATVKRFAFDSEILFIAKKLKYKIKELPITLQNSRKSHVRIYWDPVDMIWALLRIRINDLKGVYEWE